MQMSFTWMHLYFPPANWKLAVSPWIVFAWRWKFPVLDNSSPWPCTAPPLGEETAMQPQRYYHYFLNPLRPVKGYSGRDRSSARLSAKVWGWSDINGHVERRPQVHGEACVKIKSRLLQTLPLSCLRTKSRPSQWERLIGWFPHPSFILSL